MIFYFCPNGSGESRFFVRGVIFLLLFFHVLSFGGGKARAGGDVVQASQDEIFLLSIPQEFYGDVTAFLPDIKNGAAKLSETHRNIDIRKKEGRLFLMIEPSDNSCMSAFGTIETGARSFEFGVVFVKTRIQRWIIVGGYSNGCAESKWPEFHVSSIDRPCSEHMTMTFQSPDTVHTRKRFRQCRHR